MRILVDTFKNEYILDTNMDPFAPPERYYEIDISPIENDVILERWQCECLDKDDAFIEFMYRTKEASQIGVNLIRQQVAKSHNCTLRRMIKQSVSPDMYTKILASILDRKDVTIHITRIMEADVDKCSKCPYYSWEHGYGGMCAKISTDNPYDNILGDLDRGANKISFKCPYIHN